MLTKATRGSSIPTTGNVLWLKADTGIFKADGTTRPVDGEETVYWRDQSPAANHAEAIAALKPTWVASAINGHPAINIDQDEPFALTSTISLNTWDIYVVMINDGAVQTSVVLGDTATTAHYLYFGPTHGAGVRTGVTGPGTIDCTYASNVGAWTIIGTMSDGTTVTSRAANTSNSAANAGNIGFNRVGQYHNGATALDMDGKVAEIIIYDTVLSAGDRATVVTYLTTKYGLLA